MTEASAFRFERLEARHDRAAFTCGVAALDSYLRTQAGQDIRKRAAVAFVMTPDGRTIAGYYTLSQYSIELASLPEEMIKTLPKYPLVPATLLGRLALSVSYRGKRLGHWLLIDALRRCLLGGRELASAAVVVDAKEQSAETFYKRYGFIALPRSPGRLILPMVTVEGLLGPE